MSKILTDEEVKEEIARLTLDDDVKLARAELRLKYKERQKLYALRNLKKRGAALRSIGKSLEDYRSKVETIDDEIISGVIGEEQDDRHS